MVLTAPAALAHGEQMLVGALFMFLAFPAAIFLFVPWGSWASRIAAAFLFVLLTLIEWVVVAPHLPQAAPAWVIAAAALAPAVISVGFAVLLRRSSPNH